MRYKIELKNNTHWNTKDLKAFFLVALKEYNRIFAHIINDRIILYRANEIKIELKYLTKRNYGHAWYNTRSMMLRLEKDEINLQRLADCFYHELKHCEGKKHHEMAHRYCIANEYNHSWLKDIVIHKDLPKPKIILTKEDVIAKKLVKIETLKMKWLSKLKRVNNKLKVLNKKESYYSKQLQLSYQKKEATNVTEPRTINGNLTREIES